ncbi:uncharacterized protein PSFLO_03435 [Pseudozyma flocculosa]|uniref:Zinc-finger domain-containing protein n=1 Tax=Pseudozyma flocculosa TaxID=84751 RepID=A0A5C3F0J5_9BASI|nr:uncharacterized protein PSFLO_03435 [Pseudozyma flocculosa]
MPIVVVDDSDLSDLSDVGTPPPAPTPKAPSPNSKKRSNPDSSGLDSRTVTVATNPAPAPSKKPRPSSATNGAKEPQQRTLAALFGRPELKQTVPKPKAKSTGKKNYPSTSSSSPSQQPHASKVSTAPSTSPHLDSGGEGKPSTVSEHKLCHHHRRQCTNTPLLQCTFLRNGNRCQLKYCHSALQHNYGVDAASIVKNGRFMVDESQHCPPSEAKYAFKCPRCRDKCACSPCRKKKGLLPLAKVASLAKAQGSGPATDILANKAKGKDKAKTEASGASPRPGEASKAKGKRKADDITTPPPDVKPKQNRLTAGTQTRAVQPRVLKPPQPVSAPTLETIISRLPPENLRARMWLYESFVRFDKIGLPKTELNHLDRFDAWSHARVQEMLSTLLRYLAGLQHIDKGQPTKNTTKAVLAYRHFGHDLSRGEPWSAVREMLARFGLEPQSLPYVEHPLSLELENRPASPPPPRQTRNRAARGARQVDYSRQLGMLKDWEEDFGEEGDSDVPPGTEKGRRRPARRIASESDDESEEVESGAESDDTERESGSRSSRRQQQEKGQDEAAARRPRDASAESEARHDAPDMETKVALLACMVDAALMTEEIGEELKLATDEIAVLERQHKADMAITEKELAEETAELNKRAPSLIAPEFQAWKNEKVEHDRDVKWRRLDAKVFHEIQVDAHALRTGPIGYDADGREYWHLRESPASADASLDAAGTADTSTQAGGTASEPTAVDKADADRQATPSKPGCTPPAAASSVKQQGDSAGAASSGKERRADNGPASSTDPICMGTNDPAVITKLMQYVRYRDEQKQYEENHEMQQRELEQAVMGQSPENIGADTKSTAQGPGLRKAKQLMKEKQEERKAQTEMLLKKLAKARDYFAWHREEVPP